MVAVKGSKQHQMVVVPYRPYYKALVFVIFVLAMSGFSYLTYQVGMREGLSLKVAVVREKDRVVAQLEETRALNEVLRGELAESRLGGEIDSRANEEIQETVASLQSEIAHLNEEIRFYKGVMLPNVEDKGLRIERVEVSNTGRDDTFRYSLLLTQVVDKHDYVQGGVRINLLGSEDGLPRELPLSEIDVAQKEAIRFRFRYFQNIDGELRVPPGFVPQEIMVVAQSSGSRAQRLEKRFDWQLNGG